MEGGSAGPFVYGTGFVMSIFNTATLPVYHCHFDFCNLLNYHHNHPQQKWLLVLDQKRLDARICLAGEGARFGERPAEYLWYAH